MITFIIIMLSLGGSFFFSGMEIAYVSSNKMQIHIESKKETVTGRLFSKITNSPIRFLVTLLLGNTLALVFFGIFSARVMESMLIPLRLSGLDVLVIQTVVTTILIIFVADFIPKIIFRASPNFALSNFSFPCIAAYYILMPFTLGILEITKLVMSRFFGLNAMKYKNYFTKTDLDSYLSQHAPIDAGAGIAENGVEIFKNALSFPDVKVRDCMVARPEIIAADIEDGFEKLKEKFIQNGHSRMLVYSKNLDNILGYVHSHDLFRKPPDISSILINVPIIPSSMPAKDALRIFMQQHKSMALVVDEFGNTSGLLTTQDVIGVIFGEFEDEFDKVAPKEVSLGKGEFLFSARLEINYLNRKYDLGLPVSADYQTLGGCILFHSGNIPQPKEVVNIGDYTLKIISSTPNRIELVHILKNDLSEHPQ